MVNPSSAQSRTSLAGEFLHSIPREAFAAASHVTVVPEGVMVYSTRCLGWMGQRTSQPVIQIFFSTIRGNVPRFATMIKDECVTGYRYDMCLIGAL